MFTTIDRQTARNIYQSVYQSVNGFPTREDTSGRTVEWFNTEVSAMLAILELQQAIDDSRTW